MPHNSFRKGRDFYQAIKITERTRRLLGINRLTGDAVLVIEYFRSIVDLTFPPGHRYPALSKQEAAFLISDMGSSRAGIEDETIASICNLASELELPPTMVPNFQKKWRMLTDRIEQLYQIHQGLRDSF